MVFTPRQTNRVMKHRYIAQKQTHTYVANESSVNVQGKLHGGNYSMFNKYSWNTQLKYVANKQKPTLDSVLAPDTDIFTISSKIQM